METKRKDRLQISLVGLLMAGSIVTVVVVAWLGDGRNDPRDYAPNAAFAQSE